MRDGRKPRQATYGLSVAVGGMRMVGVSAHWVLSSEKLSVGIGVSVGGDEIREVRGSVARLGAEHAIGRAMTRLVIRIGQIFLLIMWDLLIRA